MLLCFYQEEEPGHSLTQILSNPLLYVHIRSPFSTLLSLFRLSHTVSPVLAWFHRAFVDINAYLL